MHLVCFYFTWASWSLEYILHVQNVIRDKILILAFKAILYFILENLQPFKKVIYEPLKLSVAVHKFVNVCVCVYT